MRIKQKADKTSIYERAKYCKKHTSDWLLFLGSYDEEKCVYAKLSKFGKVNLLEALIITIKTPIKHLFTWFETYWFFEKYIIIGAFLYFFAFLLSISFSFYWRNRSIENEVRRRLNAID